MSKQDRQGARTAQDLEYKYNFGKTFAEIMGYATDARDTANEAQEAAKEATETAKEMSAQITVQLDEIKLEVKQTTTEFEDLKTQIDGIDGTYFYIRYSAYSDGHVMTDIPDADTLYMGTCSTTEPIAPTDHTKYTWCRVRGLDGTNGLPGADGTDGSSQYFHVKYSNDGKTFTDNYGEILGDWMGTLVDSNPADSNVFSDYTWKKIVGENGENGIAGVDGKAGESCYFFVKFSANENGYPMSETPDSETKYMGTCSSNSPIAPTDHTKYAWCKVKGETGERGIPGEIGADGRTSYLHIKYSDDGETFTANNGETLGAWIGTLVDFTEADSTTFSDYTWKKFTEDVDEELELLNKRIIEQYTTLVNDCKSIVASAVETCVETKDYETFKSTVMAQFEVLVNQVEINLTTSLERVSEINGALQSQLDELTTYFRFTEDGQYIGRSDSEMQTRFANSIWEFLLNGIQQLYIDPNGVHGKQIHTDSLYIGNLIFQEQPDGSVIVS